MIMRVTDDMTTESGAPLISLADFIDENDRGLQIARRDNTGVIHVDSTSTRGKSACIDYADIQGVIDRLAEIKREIEEIYGSEDHQLR
jgi:hypothetical protein